MGGASSYLAMLAIAGFMTAVWLASKFSRSLKISSIVLEISTGVLLGPTLLRMMPQEYSVCTYQSHTDCNSDAAAIDTMKGMYCGFSAYAKAGKLGDYMGPPPPIDIGSGGSGSAMMASTRRLSGPDPTKVVHKDFQTCLIKECESSVRNSCQSSPDLFTLIGHAGVAMMIFESGMHFDFQAAKRVGAKACAVAVLGTFLPLLSGTVVVWAFGFPWMPDGVAAGTALAPTSVGIALKLLTEAKQLDKDFGQAILTAAFVDDILSLVLFNILFSVGAGDVSFMGTFFPSIMGILFMILAMVLAVVLWPFVIPGIMDIVATKAARSDDEFHKEQIVYARIRQIYPLLPPATKGDKLWGHQQKLPTDPEKENAVEELDINADGLVRTHCPGTWYRGRVEHKELLHDNLKIYTVSWENHPIFKETQGLHIVGDHHWQAKKGGMVYHDHIPINHKDEPQFVMEAMTAWQKVDLNDQVLFIIMVIFLLAYSQITQFCGTHLWGCFVAGMSFCYPPLAPHAHHVWVRQTKRSTVWMIRLFFSSTVAFAIPLKTLFSIEAFWKGSIMGIGPCILTKVCCAFFMGPPRFVIGWAMVGRAEFAYLIAQMAVSANLMSKKVFSICIWALLWATIFAPIIFAFVLKKYIMATEGPDSAASERLRKAHALGLNRGTRPFAEPLDFVDAPVNYDAPIKSEGHFHVARKTSKDSQAHGKNGSSVATDTQTSSGKPNGKERKADSLRMGANPDLELAQALGCGEEEACKDVIEQNALGNVHLGLTVGHALIPAASRHSNPSRVPAD